MSITVLWMQNAHMRDRIHGINNVIGQSKCNRAGSEHNFKPGNLIFIQAGHLIQPQYILKLRTTLFFVGICIYPLNKKLLHS